MDKIKVIVVEDDALAARRIEDLLGQDPEVEVQGCCATPRQACDALQRHRPAVVFLDIKLSGGTGFDVLRDLSSDYRPIVIFTTAYDRYAVEAFRHNALDYLVKPFDDARFREALDRAKEQLRLRQKPPSFDNRIDRLLKQLSKDEGYLNRVTVKDDDRYRVVPVESIRWIEASGYYMDIHTEKRTHKLRITMKELQLKLDPEKFLRVHRSYIVRLDFIREVQKWFKGDYMLILRNNEKIPVSQTYAREVFAALNMN